jgi:hypothetical protein
MEDAMKKAILGFVLGSAALALVGCASWHRDPGYVDVVDHQKIELVERWARQNNTQVIWVTSPTRRVPVSGT